MSEIETFLREKGVYITTTEGDSMYPMLTTGTKVMVQKPVFPLKKYDIPVYRRLDHYTMHRIIRVTKKGYVICADNRAFLEKDITDKDIIGVLCGIFRDGKLIQANDEELLSYGRKACRTYPIRFLRSFVKRVRRKLSKTIRLSFSGEYGCSSENEKHCEGKNEILSQGVTKDRT